MFLNRYLRRYALLFFAVTGALALHGWSQVPLETAPQVLERAALTYGGHNAVNGIADSVAEGTMTLFTARGSQATFEMKLLVKGKTKLQRIIRQQAGELRQGSDGEQTWDSAADGFASIARGRTLHFIESQTTRSLRRLFDYQLEGLVLRDAGTSGNARVLEAEDKDGRKTRYAIDNRNSTITNLEFITGQARDPFSRNTIFKTDAYVFSDYRRVQGILTPFRIERYVDGIKAEEMVFRSISYNTSIKDEAFKR